MGITSTDRWIQSTTCKKFLKWIFSNRPSCNIGVYIYCTSGRATNWFVVFRIPRSLNEKYQRVLAAVSAASSSAPDYLTRKKLCDAIVNIRIVVNYTRVVLATSLLDDLLPENVTQSVARRSTMEVEQISEISDLINCGDYVDENENVFLCVYS